MAIVTPFLCIANLWLGVCFTEGRGSHGAGSTDRAAPARGSPEAVEAFGVAGCTTLDISPQNCSVQGASPWISPRIIARTANSTKPELLGKTNLHRVLMKEFRGHGESWAQPPVTSLLLHTPRTHCTCATQGFSLPMRNPKYPLELICRQVGTAYSGESLHPLLWHLHIPIQLSCSAGLPHLTSTAPQSLPYDFLWFKLN